MTPPNDLLESHNSNTSPQVGFSIKLPFHNLFTGVFYDAYDAELLKLNKYYDD